MVERIIKKLINSSCSFLFVFILMMVATKVMALQIFILFGERSIGLFKNSYANVYLLFIILVLSLVTIYSRKNSQNKVYIYPLAFLFLFVINLLVSVNINYDSHLNFTQSLWGLLGSYIPVILFLITNSFKLKNVNIKVAVNTLIIFGIMQMILGMYQYLGTTPLFAVYYKEESILNPVFYLNGASSSNSYFLDMGAKVRAFGMTDSGLTLGMMTMLILSFVLFSNKLNKFMKVFFSTICLIVIYMTLTRIIYLSVFVLFFFSYALKNNKYSYIKIVYSTILIFQIFFTTVFQEMSYKIINFFTKGALNLDSLKSRVDGVNFFLDISNINFIRLLFGTNITSKLGYIQTPYSVDNEFLKIFLDVGVLGYFSIIFIYTKYLFKFLRDEEITKQANNLNLAFICFLLTFPFLGILNVVNYFYFPIFTIFIFIKNQEDKKLLV